MLILFNVFYTYLLKEYENKIENDNLFKFILFLIDIKKKEKFFGFIRNIKMIFLILEITKTLAKKNSICKVLIYLNIFLFMKNIYIWKNHKKCSQVLRENYKGNKFLNYLKAINETNYNNKSIEKIITAHIIFDGQGV